MRSLLTVAVLSLATASAYAQAAKTCDDVKAEIAKKIEANGVKTYTLDVVPTDKANDAKGKVVGSCEGGAKKIMVIIPLTKYRGFAIFILRGRHEDATLHFRDS